MNYDYSKDLVDMNATTSQDAFSIFVKLSKNVDNLFLTAVLKFSSDDSSNFDIEYMNKTVDVCKFPIHPRYEPLIQLVYRIISKKVHLPQRCPLKKV